MNSDKQNILNHLKTANKMGNFFLRPFIYNLVVNNITGSSPLTSRSGMGTPTNPAIRLWPQDYEFGWVKFAYSCSTRLLRLNVVKNGFHGQVVLTETAGNPTLADASYQPGYIGLGEIAGSGELPFIKGSPDWLDTQYSYYFKLADESGSASTLTAYLAISGQQIVPQGGWHVQQDWTDYQPKSWSTNRVQIPANGSLQVDINIAGGDAIIDKITGDFSGACTMDIQYGSIPLTNGPIHSDNIKGETNLNGVVPTILAQQMAIAYNKSISIIFTDLSGSNNNVSLTFSGYSMYR